MLGKIVVPLDGSALAELVLPTVAELAYAFGSEVTLVGVYGSGDESAERGCHDYLEGKAGELREGLTDSLAAVRTAVIRGKASDGITHLAAANEADLIIMSSHGRSGAMPWSFGGTANRVLRKAGVPIILVRVTHSIPPSSLFVRLLVPLDGSEASASVLPFVTALAGKIPCDIIFLRVAEVGRHYRTIGGLDYVPFKDRALSSATEEALNYLDEVCAASASLGTGVSREVRVGDAAREILRLAAERNCTLIAMATHGHSGVEQLTLGSVTSKVLEVGRQSVCLVPSEH